MVRGRSCPEKMQAVNIPPDAQAAALPTLQMEAKSIATKTTVLM